MGKRDVTLASKFLNADRAKRSDIERFRATRPNGFAQGITNRLLNGSHGNIHTTTGS